MISFHNERGQWWYPWRPCQLLIPPWRGNSTTYIPLITVVPELPISIRHFVIARPSCSIAMASVVQVEAPISSSRNGSYLGYLWWLSQFLSTSCPLNRDLLVLPSSPSSILCQKIFTGLGCLPLSTRGLFWATVLECLLVPAPVVLNFLCSIGVSSLARRFFVLHLMALLAEFSSTALVRGVLSTPCFACCTVFRPRRKHYRSLHHSDWPPEHQYQPFCYLLDNQSELALEESTCYLSCSLSFDFGEQSARSTTFLWSFALVASVEILH